jgi:hypothetical protein
MSVTEGSCDTVASGENDSVVSLDSSICMSVELTWRKLSRPDPVSDCVVRSVEPGNHTLPSRDGSFSDSSEPDGAESSGAFLVDPGLRTSYVIASGMSEEVMYPWDRLSEEKGTVEVEGLEPEESSAPVSSLKSVRKFSSSLTSAETSLYSVMGTVFKDSAVPDKFICGKIKRVLEPLFKEAEVPSTLCGGRLVPV